MEPLVLSIREIDAAVSGLLDARAAILKQIEEMPQVVDHRPEPLRAMDIIGLTEKQIETLEAGRKIGLFK